MKELEDWGMRHPRVSAPFPGPKAREILALDQKFMSQSMTRLYPIVAEQGSGCWVSDVDGNVFLDFTAGIAVSATGHLHPQITGAIEKQAHRLLHFSLADFYHPLGAQLAQRLAKLFPGGGDGRVFLCNSGAEAIEAAIKLARWHTKRTHLIAFHGAFHGRTTGALALSSSKQIHKDGFGPLLPGVTHVPFSLSGLRFLDQVLFRTMLRPTEVAAIFFEPIQGENGVVIPEDGLLAGLRRLCDRHDILLVADEVQTGMGRTGKMFACEHWGGVPDIICVAKGIASGLPLGAIIAKADVMDWPAGKHTSTFGGNPLSCAAALATIDALQGGLIENAAAMGELLLRRLREIAAGKPLIREVRGRGLLVGIELARNGRPAIAEREALLNTALRHGLLLLGGGESVVRMCPPLVVTAEEIGIALQIFENALAEVLNERRAA
jgi:4-aminobutyrate aminotransferase